MIFTGQFCFNDGSGSHYDLCFVQGFSQGAVGGVAVLGGRMKGVLTSPSFARYFQMLSGFVLIGLGIKIAFAAAIKTK